MIEVTRELMEATYERLMLTPPFSGWGLPDADDVVFRVLKTNRQQADYSFEKKRHIIRVSCSRHKTLHSLDMTVAHEMVHMRDQLLGVRSHHGETFNKMADEVCRLHGFDRGQF